MAAPQLAEQLRAVLAAALAAPDLRVGELRLLTGGASRETWSFEALAAGAAPRRLILRRDPPGAPRPEAPMSAEADAIRAAGAAGVPGPEVVAHDDDPAALGAPFMVVSFVEGETVPRRILRDERFAAVRPRLAESCGEILARIHAIPPAAVPGLPRTDPLELVRGELDSFADRSPALELGLRWLERNRPPGAAAGVVHGDFRNGNLIVGPDGVRAVLDWELVHLGDPMEDLGRLCARCWRFGATDHPVGGFGEYADLFAGYERVCGRPVDPEVVRWWELFACLDWGALCMIQAWRHLSGTNPSIELAAVGRRVWEQEYDTLLHLREAVSD